MMNKKIKIIIISFFSLSVVALMVFRIINKDPDFWKINISDCIEVFILIFVSYYLVDRQNDEDRHKERVLETIAKIQNTLLDPNFINVDSGDDKNVTKVKLTRINNLVEIIKDDLSKYSEDSSAIVSDVSNLYATAMDHIDDVDFIEKYKPDIYRLVNNIDTKLENIKINMN